MQAEPVVVLGDLAHPDDQPVWLLDHFWGLHQNLALGFGNSKDPIFAIVAVDFDLQTSVQEAGGDILLGDGSNVR